jgi:hypothetical protein
MLDGLPTSLAPAAGKGETRGSRYFGGSGFRIRERQRLETSKSCKDEIRDLRF